MRSPASLVESKGERGLTAALFLLATALYAFEIGWGLPNGNATWSVDAIQPVTPLAVAHASFTKGWNSGWFFYKYPLAHFFVLCAAYAPYLGFLRFSGGFSSPRPEYPYGFADPEAVLYTLALIGRLVTLVMAVATVWLLFRIAQRLWDSRAALWAAGAAAVLPPVVFYAHTTNLDIPQLLWMALAWYAAVRLVDGLDFADVILFGAASGMALATRESAYAWLLGLSALVVIVHVRACVHGRLAASAAAFRLLGGALSGGFVLLLASNAFYNPLGFWRRLLYMSGHLPPEVLAQYVARAPLVFDRLLPDAHQLVEMVRLVAWSMGFPWFALSVGGMLLSLRREPRGAVCVLAPVVPYFLSVAGFPSLAVRYLLPATVGFALLGGWAASRIWAQSRAGKVVVTVAAAFTLLHGAGVDYLLAKDSRYQVEAWLREHARPGTRLETYHDAPYLPRPVTGVEIDIPPFAETTRAGIEARKPDLVLISLSNIKRITQHYHPTESAPIRPPENVVFLHAILSGELGYRRAARFHVRWPLLPRRFIPSLNPPMLLLVREEQ
jgi:hypothetical protein